jgi:hypothetical protein
VAELSNYERGTNPKAESRKVTQSTVSADDTRAGREFGRSLLIAKAAPHTSGGRSLVPTERLGRRSSQPSVKTARPNVIQPTDRLGHMLAVRKHHRVWARPQPPKPGWRYQKSSSENDPPG